MQVFKALADGEEESVQPKKPKTEPQPRAPYVPKQPQVAGQKRHGKQGTQHGPKGKKQKKDVLVVGEEAEAAEEAPPLPPPDAPRSDESAVEVDMEADDVVPPPPLPPPSPERVLPDSAVANGHSGGHRSNHQASATRLLPTSPAQPSAAAQPQPVSLPLPGASNGTSPRPQVGFRLQGNRRQKLNMAEREDPVAQAMRERLQRHLIAQQLQQQQMHQQLQQQQVHQQLVGHTQDSLLQQAAHTPLPAPGLEFSALSQPFTAQQRLQHGNPGDQDQVNGNIPGLIDEADAHVQLRTDSQQPDGKPQLQQVHQHSRQHSSSKRKAPEQPNAFPPGLESSPQQQQQQQHRHPPQQLSQQLSQQLPGQPPQAELAPGLTLHPEQLQPQLQRLQSHRHVHHRRSSKRSHRKEEAAAWDVAQPSTEAQQHLPDLDPYDQPVPQQSGYGTDPMTDPEPLQLPPELDAPSPASRHRPHPGAAAPPAPSWGGAAAQAPANGLERSLAGLAETGGPVALANGGPVAFANGHSAGAGPAVQVLADDVKSLLR